MSKYGHGVIMLHGASGVQLEMSVDECEWVMGMIN